jgi:undecaprenyl phosphate N,N'-diacetylbacillosamine 1-phosphate transferase
MYPRFKDFFDRVFAFFLLLILSPLFLLISISIRLSSIRTIFFVHPRPGLYGQTIKIIKFKTMNDKKDINGELLLNHQRITKLGAFLRKSSLDEIPQLINVIKGDISLIGPRPLEIRYLPLYSKEQNRRHEVKPGISGWAQVNGRNAISWEEKFNYDIYYVDNQSLRLDLKIFLLTIKKVVSGSDVNADPNQTVEPLDIYLRRKQNGV